jgi:hypothetical protein
MEPERIKTRRRGEIGNDEGSEVGLRRLPRRQKGTKG